MGDPLGGAASRLIISLERIVGADFDFGEHVHRARTICAPDDICPTEAAAANNNSTQHATKRSRS